MEAGFGGGCGCGAVRYRSGPVLYMGNCHCRDCQHATGAGYLASLDDPSVYKPMREIYTASAQPWDLLHDDVPHFTGMPVY
jgi:hypothetical protein